jgi:hypothetical protein
MKANLSVVLNALGMGMAVSAVVLLYLDAVALQDAVMLLGIGLFCVAMDAMRRVSRVEDAPPPAGTSKGNRKSSGKRKKSTYYRLKAGSLDND